MCKKSGHSASPRMQIRKQGSRKKWSTTKSQADLNPKSERSRAEMALPYSMCRLTRFFEKKSCGRIGPFWSSDARRMPCCKWSSEPMWEALARIRSSLGWNSSQDGSSLAKNTLKISASFKVCDNKTRVEEDPSLRTCHVVLTLFLCSELYYYCSHTGDIMDFTLPPPYTSTK
jgi:hypothetical protein